MEFEFDPAKERANIAKHGVSLLLGVEVIENGIGSAADDWRDYGERRVNAYGKVNDRLYVCTFTMRGTVFRIISVRKVSRQELREWRT